MKKLITILFILTSLRGFNQNLLKWSEDFASNSWSKNFTTVIPNVLNDINGLVTADKITATSNSHVIYQDLTVNASTQYTFSFYALRGTISQLKYCIYNPATASNIVALTSYYSLTNTNSFSRISVTFTTPVGCSSIRVYPLRDANATGTVFFWGAQINTGASVSSYVKTEGSTYYIDFSTGSDANNGTSAVTAWKTISKVNNSSFSGGDQILFKRGGVWRESLNISSSGNSSYPITIADYGTGAKPKIIASKDVSATSQWVVHSGNIWKTTNKIAEHSDLANMIFNNELLVGVKKRTQTELTSQGFWSLNQTDTLIYLYSAGNPGNYYNHVEAAGALRSEDNIVANSKSYLTFRNLDIRYSGNNGLFITSCSNIIVEYCDFSWCGGWYVPNQSGRLGNGLQLWEQNNNITGRYCTFNQIYDAGISPQGGSTTSNFTMKNLFFHNNRITNCYYSFEFWGIGAAASADSVRFENNTCAFAGGSWSVAQRPDIGNAAHFKLLSNSMSLSNIFIRNNVFYKSTDANVYTHSEYISQGADFNTDAMLAALNFDYNIYFQLPGGVNVRWKNATNYAIDDLTLFRMQQSKEADGKFTNPNLISETNLHLNVTSQAINAGKDIGLPFAGSAPDLGAYETDSIFQLLPLQFLDFTGHWEGQKILLRWKTLNEINTANFEVEKSTNGTDFKILKSVLSNKSSSTYLLIDNHPFIKNNFYRIKQLDKDGKYTYSKIILIDNAKSPILNIFPNPARNKIQVRFDAPLNNKQPIYLSIKAVLGSEMRKYSFDNSLENIVIDISYLKSGIYLLTFECDNFVVSKRLLKQ